MTISKRLCCTKLVGAGVPAHLKFQLYSYLNDYLAGA
jgi:hypothetical protein